MVTLDRPYLFPNYYHKSAGLMLTAMLTASDKCTCQIGCCFAVPPCRTTAERHRYTAVQPTWILPADAAWRHHGQHKGWKQHILWVDVVCVYTSLDLFIVVMYNFNPIIYSVNDSTGYRNWVKKKKKKRSPSVSKLISSLGAKTQRLIELNRHGTLWDSGICHVCYNLCGK